MSAQRKTLCRLFEGRELSKLFTISSIIGNRYSEGEREGGGRKGGGSKGGGGREGGREEGGREGGREGSREGGGGRRDRERKERKR